MPDLAAHPTFAGPPDHLALSSGVTLAYRQVGAGEPILLVHGFGSSMAVNWQETGWVDALVDAGRRVVLFDNRGHGGSTKLYDPAAYTTAVMAADAAELMERLGTGPAPVLGYSMGARIAAVLALARPELVTGMVLGGLGIHLVHGGGLPVTIADAMEAPSRSAVTDPMGKLFRAFAERTGSDRAALAACIRGSRQTLSEAEAGRLRQPTLVAVGTRDAIAGSAEALVALMPDAEVLDIPGRDHNPAVGDKTFKAGVLDFLARRGL